jgi:hypothetical protein
METIFIQLPIHDCEAAPLNGIFFADCSSKSPQEALEKFLKNDAQVGNTSYKIVYTAGHYGEDEHLWDLSHCEIYDPHNVSQPPMVIVYYRPRRSDVGDLFHESDKKD